MSATKPSPQWHPSGHCAVFACDIASFGDTSRNDHVREHMRSALYERLERSFNESGISYEGCYREDRGDGAFVITPPDVATELLVSSVVDLLRAGLRRYNELSSETARIRLRVAVHTGEARWDGNGIVGTSVNHTFRILEAPPFKEALRDSGACLALIVSQRVYDDVVKHGWGLVDPDEYHRVDVSVKETTSTAWIRVPGIQALSPALSRKISGEISQDVEPAVGTDADRRDVPRGEPTPAQAPMTLFDLVDRVLEVPIMASQKGREQVVGVLRSEIAGMIPRQSEARPDTFCVVRTCLDYPGGLQELFAAIKWFAGDSLAVHRLERTIARMLPD
jgi:class 3 adenylate cyclase